MDIFDKLSRAVESGRELVAEEKDLGQVIGNGIEAYLNKGKVARLRPSDYLKSGLGWVYACVNAIADDIASNNLKLRRVSANGDDKEVDRSPVLDLLYKVNDAQTRYDFIHQVAESLELTGEAPIFVSFKGRTPDQLLLLRPDRLTVLPGEGGDMIGGYKYQIASDTGTREVKLEPFEVVPLKYADPDNPLRGKGPLQASAATYEIDQESEQFNKKFFGNAAHPSAAFSTEKALSKEAFRRLEKKLKEKFNGADNAHKTLLLEGGLKFQSLQLTQKDMDFMEQQKFSRDKIMAIFRVTKSVLGIVEDVNRANAEAGDYVFAKRVVEPKLMRIVEQLNEFLLPLFPGTEGLYLDYDDPVPQNVELVIKQAESGITNGYMTPNEARALVGLDPIDGGDDIREPQSFAPAQLSVRGKRRRVSPFRARAVQRLAEKELRLRAYAIAKSAIANAIFPKIYAAIKQARQAKGLEGKDAKYAFQERQLSLATEAEPDVAAKMANVFRAQKAEALRQLVKSKGADVALDQDVEGKRVHAALRPRMGKLMREQAAEAFRIVGVQRSAEGKAATFTERLMRSLDKRLFRLAFETTKETNRQLRDTLKEGLKAEESIAQLKRRVADLFDGIAGYRAERIARSETIRGSNQAAESAWIDSEVVEAKEWLATRDERTDEDCQALDGTIVPLGGTWFKKGETFHGHELDYEDIVHPPLHVNCRCTLIPVLAPPGA